MNEKTRDKVREQLWKLHIALIEHFLMKLKEEGHKVKGMELSAIIDLIKLNQTVLTSYNPPLEERAFQQILKTELPFPTDD